MPLLRNNFQPYFPDPNRPGHIDCAGDYCWPFITGDKFYQQWYQTPCSTNLVVDPDFDDPTYGADEITNGDFATNLSGWTTGNWTWNSGQAQAPAPPTANFLTQTIAAGIQGRIYRITFDVSGMATGDHVNVHLGTTTAWYEFEENGSYDVFIRFRSDDLDLSFVQPTTNTGQILIDNVTLQLVTYNSWNTNLTWSVNMAEGTACKLNTGTGNLVNGTSDYMTSGDYYYVLVTVSNVTGGSGQVYIDDGSGTETNLQTAITSNGTYEYWITASQTGQIAFKPDTDFIGCVSGFEVYRLRNDYSGDIVASDDTRYDISSYFVYYRDKVVLNKNLFDLLELDFACYTIEIFDACLIEGDNLVTDGTFALGDFTYWQRNNGSNQYAITSNAGVLIFEPLEGANLIVNGGFASGASWTAGAGWAIGSGVATHTPGSTATLSQSVTISPPATPPAVLQHWWQLTISGWTTGTITVTVGDVTSLAFGVNDTITAPLVPTVSGVVTFAITPSSNFDGSIDNVALHEATQIWSASPVLTNVANTDMVAGNYQVEYDITARTGSGNIGLAVGLQGMSQANTINTTLATHTVQITNYVPGAQRAYIQGRFRVGNIYYPGRITIDNVSAVRVEPFDATYITECLDYRSEYENTQVITAYSDQDALGFAFTGVDFLLQFRIQARGMNPYYPREGYNTVSGTGNTRLGYAGLQKVYPYFFDPVSQTAHDTIAAAMSCDHLLIGVSESDSIEYVADIEDYIPSWREEGDYDLAPSSILLRLKEGGVKFNRHT